MATDTTNLGLQKVDENNIVSKFNGNMDKIDSALADTGWVSQGIINNMSVLSGPPAEDIEFRKVGKRVEIKGSFPTLSKSGTITIPTSVTPGHDVTFQTIKYVKVSNSQVNFDYNSLVSIRIASSGTIYVEVDNYGTSVNENALNYIHLSGISYFVG